MTGKAVFGRCERKVLSESSIELPFGCCMGESRRDVVVNVGEGVASTPKVICRVFVAVAAALPRPVLEKSDVKSATV